MFCLGLYLIISLGMVPVLPLPAPVPPPDLIYCFAAAWLVRRPDYVLSSAVAAAALITEFMHLHTPGLWSAAMLLLAEYLRRNSERIRNLPFWLEWAAVALPFAAAQAASQLILAVFFLPAAPPGVIALHTGVTCLAYPAIVLGVNWAFRVTKPNSSDSRMFRAPAAAGGAR